MLVVLTAEAKPAGPQTFTVTISKIGDKKVAVMKEIRALTNLSLKDVRARENPLTHVPLLARENPLTHVPLLPRDDE